MQIERKRTGRQRNHPTWPEQSRKNRNLRTIVSRVLDTRKILFQNVTSFGHKARMWLLSDQMDYDIMGWRNIIWTWPARQRRRSACKWKDI